MLFFCCTESLIQNKGGSIHVQKKSTNACPVRKFICWRPIDRGNGHYFAILAGGGNISETDVILNRGYDYAYTFNPSAYSQPWGVAPDLVSVDGNWGIPENQPSMPEGSQPTLQIVLTTNNKNYPFKERYIDVVKLPSGVSKADLPAEVRKYLIKNGSYAASTWLQDSNGKWYYFNLGTYTMADTHTPDGYYVDATGAWDGQSSTIDLTEKLGPGIVGNSNK